MMESGNRVRTCDSVLVSRCGFHSLNLSLYRRRSGDRLVFVVFNPELCLVFSVFFSFSLPDFDLVTGLGLGLLCPFFCAPLSDCVPSDYMSLLLWESEFTEGDRNSIPCVKSSPPPAIPGILMRIMAC